MTWRILRSIRNLLIENSNFKMKCVTALVDYTSLQCMKQFPQSAAVQSQALRVIASLAFGNDLVRRRLGEKGVMAAVVASLRSHEDDESTVLHACTAITNLCHGSFENTSRCVLYEFECQLVEVSKAGGGKRCAGHCVGDGQIQGQRKGAEASMLGDNYTSG